MTQSVTFCVWLVITERDISSPTHAVTCIKTSWLFSVCCMVTPFCWSILPSMGIRAIASSCLSWIMYKPAKHIFCWSTCFHFSWVYAQDQNCLDTHPAFWKTFKLFSLCDCTFPSLLCRLSHIDIFYNLVLKKRSLENQKKALNPQSRS